MSESSKVDPSGEGLQDRLRRERPPEPIDPKAMLAALEATGLRTQPKKKPDAPHVEESERMPSPPGA